jgi:Xaa-Pro aminopeptidase
MFTAKTYQGRRERLNDEMNGGIVLIPGNPPSPMNGPNNHLPYRQDSSYLYYFGHGHAGLTGVLDTDNGESYLFGDELTMDDIIWMGPQETMIEKAEKSGVKAQCTLPHQKLHGFIEHARSQGRKIHYLPQYRAENALMIASLLNVNHQEAKKGYSEELARAVSRMRAVKEPQEVEEMERYMHVAWKMHVEAMKMARPGVKEQEIAGTIEGIALRHGCRMTFPPIVSINGQTLHNPYHHNTLKKGRMLLCDAGAESPMGYGNDITRTTPVGGKFSQRQKEIYQIVLDAMEHAQSLMKPGTPFRDVHLAAMQVIAEGLTTLSLMKGDPKEAVAQGAHALFCPHGLGHMMGLEDHDMESIGEQYFAYDDQIKRSNQFGLSALRFGRALEENQLVSNEPGIYFIPELIEQWKTGKKHDSFINYEKVESYLDFGGVRLEDDIHITKKGARLTGKPIPKTIEEIEALCR